MANVVQTFGDQINAIIAAAGGAYVAKLLTPPPTNLPAVSPAGAGSVAKPATPLGGASSVMLFGAALIAIAAFILIRRRGG